MTITVIQKGSHPGLSLEAHGGIRSSCPAGQGQPQVAAATILAQDTKIVLPLDGPNPKLITSHIWQERLPGLDDDFRPARAISTFPMPQRALEQARLEQQMAQKPGGTLPYSPQPLDINPHQDFDLAFRDAYHHGRANGVPFSYQPHQAGLCLGVLKAMESLTAAAWGSDSAEQAPMESYVQRYDLHGCHARVQWPDDYQWFQGERKRIPGTPAFRFDPSSPYHWKWVAIPGTEAGEADWVDGTYHAVAARRAPLPPSDPTIEQFQKHQDVILYLVDSC